MKRVKGLTTSGLFSRGPQGPCSGVLDLSRGKSRVTRNGTEPVFDRVPLRPLTRNHREENSKQQPILAYKRSGGEGGEGRQREAERTADDDDEDDNDDGDGNEREEGMEPVFERSGESGGYTFTDLHYPRFVPPPASLPLAPFPPRHLPLFARLTPTRAHRQPTNCPVTHEPVVHVIAMTHKMTPGVLSLLVLSPLPRAASHLLLSSPLLSPHLPSSPFSTTFFRALSFIPKIMSRRLESKGCPRR